MGDDVNCHLHLREGTVYLPTMGKMEQGFYRGVEPVAVVSASNVEGYDKRCRLHSRGATRLYPYCAEVNGNRLSC